MRGKSLIGEPFGRLVVRERLPHVKGKAPRWRCDCECGGTVEVVTGGLTSGMTRSCGCLRREVSAQRNTTHGLSETPEYNTWCHIKFRCYNPKFKQFKDYGGRGITICGRWRDDFGAFLEDMGRKPSPELEIDRKDNDGHYSCGKCEECRRQGWTANCWWTTSLENNNNKRSNITITAFGETMTAAEWSRDPRCQATQMMLWIRITKSGWNPEEAITTPTKEVAPRRGPVEAFGESKILADWSKDDRCVVDYGTLKTRVVQKGWDAEKAIVTPSVGRGTTLSITAFGESKTVPEWARDPRCRVRYHALQIRIRSGRWNPEEAITTPALPTGAWVNGRGKTNIC